MDVVIHIICVLYILLQYQLLCSGPGYECYMQSPLILTTDKVQGKPRFSDGVERSH